MKNVLKFMTLFCILSSSIAYTETYYYLSEDTKNISDDYVTIEPHDKGNSVLIKIHSPEDTIEYVSLARQVNDTIFFDTIIKAAIYFNQGYMIGIKYRDQYYTLYDLNTASKYVENTLNEETAKLSKDLTSDMYDMMYAVASDRPYTLPDRTPKTNGRIRKIIIPNDLWGVHHKEAKKSIPRASSGYSQNTPVTPTHNFSSAPYNSGGSSTREKRREACSCCNGTGISSIATPVPGYGSSEQHWCDICRCMVGAGHGAHLSCRCCRGIGYTERY
jgi:hypothetical protein